MSEANRDSRDVESQQISDTLALGNKRSAVERAYLLMDGYIAEMELQEANAALAKIKTALRVRQPSK